MTTITLPLSIYNLCRPFLSHHYCIHSLSVLLQEPCPGGHKIDNFVDLLLVIMTMYLV